MSSCCRPQIDSPHIPADKLPLKQKFSFVSGHVLNDLAGSAWFSYLLVFLTKVAGLSNPHAGYVVLAGQIMEAISSPVIGQLCDRTVSSYGRRKTWHLVGTVGVSITFPMIFMRCIGCEERPSSTKIWYYICLALVFCISWGSTQIGHLSLIPEISRKASEAIELSALRSAVTFICGIFIYVVTWVLLGQNKEGSLSPKVWKQFMYLGVIVVAVGNAFNLIFHIWTVEPPPEKGKKDEKNNNNGSCLPNGDQKKVLLEVSLLPKSKVETSVCESYGQEALLIASESTSCSEAMEIISDQHIEEKQDKVWKDWLKYPQFYTTNMLYTCSRLVVNISQAYLPLYLTETLRFEKESIAYFPLIILITGVLSSPAIKPMNHRLGSKITYSIGSFIALAACFWFYLQPIEGRNAVYATAVLIGCGGSIMLATSLSMIAELIGEHKTSGAFVYGTIGFTDKVSSGIVIAIIQQMNPRSSGLNSMECLPCDLFIRRVISITPGCSAVLGLFLITFFFKSIFICTRKVENKDKATQTCNIEEEIIKRTSKTDPQENNNITDKPVSPRCTDTDRKPISNSTAHRRSVETNPHANTHNAMPIERKSAQLSNSQKIDQSLFEKRNFLSSSWWNLESQAAVRLATYEKMSPLTWRKSMAV